MNENRDRYNDYYNSYIGPEEKEKDKSVLQVKQVELDTAQKISISRVSLNKDLKNEENKKKNDGSAKNSTNINEAVGEDLRKTRRASWYEKNFNEEKANFHKDQEVQTDSKNQIYKSYYEFLKSNSKGVQVDESDKTTLSQMRFDLFKKNIHLKYTVDVPLFEIKKEISELDEMTNNRTFWDYLSYNTKTHKASNRSRGNKSAWDNDEQALEDFDDNGRNHKSKNSENKFTWQVDEFKK
jgi:hypothetical protein